MKKLHGTYSIQPLTITDAVVADEAAIQEHKLLLDFGTTYLKDRIDTTDTNLQVHIDDYINPHGELLIQDTIRVNVIETEAGFGEETIVIRNAGGGNAVVDLQGDLHAHNITTSDDVTIGGDLDVQGSSSIDGDTHLTGNVIIEGSLSVQGESTIVSTTVTDYDRLRVSPSSLLNETAIVVAPDDTGVIHPEPEVIKYLKLDMPYIGASARLSDGSIVLCGSGDYGDDSRIVVLSPDLTELKSALTRGIPGMGLSVFNITDPSVAVGSDDSIFVTGKSKKSDGTYDSVLLKLSSTLGLIGVMKLGVGVDDWYTDSMCVAGDHVLVAIGDDNVIKRYSTSSISYEDTIEGFTDPERGFVSFEDSPLYVFDLTVDPDGNIWMSGYDSDLGKDLFYVLDPDFNLVDTYVVDFSYKGDNVTDEWFLYYAYEGVSNGCTFSPDGRFMYMACYEYIAKYSLEDRKIVGVIRPCMTGYEDYPDDFDYGFAEYRTVEVLDSGDLLIPEYADTNNIYVASSNLEDVVYLEGEASQTDYSVVFNKNIGIAETVTEEEWEADGPWLDDIVNTIIEPEGDTFTGNLLELQKREGSVNSAALIVRYDGTVDLLSGSVNLKDTNIDSEDGNLLVDNSVYTPGIHTNKEGFKYVASQDRPATDTPLDLALSDNSSFFNVNKNGSVWAKNEYSVGESSAVYWDYDDEVIKTEENITFEADTVRYDNANVVFSSDGKKDWKIFNRNSSLSLYYDVETAPKTELTETAVTIAQETTSVQDLVVNGDTTHHGNIYIDPDLTIDGVDVGLHIHSGEPGMGERIPATSVIGLQEFLDAHRETVEDYVGAMISNGNTEKGINVTYNDDTGKLNFDVADFTITAAGNVSGKVTITDLASNTFSMTVLDSDKVDGLHAHTGRNNEANKVVRTDGNGYIQAGWINTTSGNSTATISKIYASNDDYIRYYTPENFARQILAFGGTVKNSHTHDVVNGLKPVRGSSSFVGNNGASGRSISIAARSNTNYSVSITPTANPGGYLGEVWVIKGTSSFTVYNSGTATVAFDYIMIG